jgi:hypothetical protein
LADFENELANMDYFPVYKCELCATKGKMFIVYMIRYKTKDYKIGICCFSAKNATLRSKSKDWLAWNQDNVSEWSDIASLSDLGL